MCNFAQNRFLKCENSGYGDKKRHHGVFFGRLDGKITGVE